MRPASRATVSREYGKSAKRTDSVQNRIRLISCVTAIDNSF
jgi:hypothetical protein